MHKNMILKPAFRNKLAPQTTPIINSTTTYY